jgi:ankyrin repeat protein
MARSKNGITDVHSTAGKIAPVRILKILTEYGADLRKSNALRNAAHGQKPGRVEVMTYLLDEVGVPINQREFEYDPELFGTWKTWGLGTALHQAVKHKSIECIQFMLDRGIDRDIRDTKGRKAVDLAREYQHEECVALLQ